ncbi:hypothetical protein [Undibacterium fentianense]|uniref:DUF885 domain-containing protein n=1 Tax=Undibacterium fentianense TaxID=2828728 RepID=A0A941E2L4_9BURK|nr:hypothetical protein [Undibacterium fentianense]MBR7801205.1 hypothetical protein [Undibacterium fentianense]
MLKRIGVLHSVFGSILLLSFHASAYSTSSNALGTSTGMGASYVAQSTRIDGRDDYEALVKLFEEWRRIERPILKEGAPDYTLQARARASEKVRKLHAQLLAMKTKNWTKAQQIDWKIVNAEMNGYEFNQRVLQPWVRDPAFYQSLYTEASDTPAREGPTNHATIELWKYRFPLSEQDQMKLAKELAVVPPLLTQAKRNLTGNARDLWLAGINTFELQGQELQALEKDLAQSISPALKLALGAAKKANAEFISWLTAQAPHKTGPSGIGKDNYTWYQQNVHLVPMTWQQEVDLLQRELDRAWANLKLEEQRNKDLPPMHAASTDAEYKAMADRAASKLMRFLADKQVMPIKANMEPALREHLQSFVAEDKRNFFSITLHYDPAALYCHWYHWFDLAQMRDEPHTSPIRRGPLLYNIWDNRNEGIATGVEEMFMHMGLHDDSPRSRELVWILLAQRAARGLGSLYAHANLKNMEEASRVHLDWTPRNWMRREPHLLKFEQHLYLRQPGYGTSYVVGKYLIERLMTQRAKQLEVENKPFLMQDFFKTLNDLGNIPIMLTSEQLLAK